MKPKKHVTDYFAGKYLDQCDGEDKEYFSGNERVVNCNQLGSTKFFHQALGMMREARDEKALALSRDMLLFYKEGYKLERREMIKQRLIGQSGGLNAVTPDEFMVFFNHVSRKTKSDMGAHVNDLAHVLGLEFILMVAEDELALPTPIEESFMKAVSTHMDVHDAVVQVINFFNRDFKQEDAAASFEPIYAIADVRAKKVLMRAFNLLCRVEGNFNRIMTPFPAAVNLAPFNLASLLELLDVQYKSRLINYIFYSKEGGYSAKFDSAKSVKQKDKRVPQFTTLASLKTMIDTFPKRTIATNEPRRDKTETMLILCYHLTLGILEEALHPHLFVQQQQQSVSNNNSNSGNINPGTVIVTSSLAPDGGIEESVSDMVTEDNNGMEVETSGAEGKPIDGRAMLVESTSSQLSTQTQSQSPAVDNSLTGRLQTLQALATRFEEWEREYQRKFSEVYVHSMALAVKAARDELARQVNDNQLMF